jgi:hypothetical protein
MACRTAARILVHYMINGGFLGAGGAANRDNNITTIFSTKSPD